LLEETEPAWRRNLAGFFARPHFILGPQLAAFEREWAAFLTAKFAVGVANGTDAIELSLRDAGITSPRQEVITSALTAPFTGIGIVSAGCAIRFADVDEDTLLIDPADAAARLTRRTAAIVPVHLYGQPADLTALRKLGPPLIQDACQAHGATHRGRPLTAYGRYVAYSFYPTKNLGALGDGGAIVTNSQAIDGRLREWRDGGRRRGEQVAYFQGVNSRLDELQCCYLRAFLEKLDEWNADRRRIAAIYDHAFEGCDAVRPVRTSAESVRHLYVVRVQKRDAVRADLAARGIATGIHYPRPLHLMPAFREAGLRRGDLPRAERACREILSLPLWPRMPDAMVAEAADRLLTRAAR
jgi:dTDP-3-amino-3,4,6-trideoxy-alpha-D-glucose transaminase